MKARFFVVGKYVFLIGSGSQKGNFFNFDINLTKDVNVGRAFFRFKKGKYFLHIKLDEGISKKYLLDVVTLLTKLAEKYFKADRVILESCLEGMGCFTKNGWVKHKSENFFFRRKNNTDKKKYKKLVDVYRNPYDVPWNFMPIEIDFIKSVTLPEFKKKKNGKMLDLGSGYGKNILALEQEGFNVEGLEISKYATERHLSFLGGNLNISSIEKNNLSDETYDLVLDVGCLHSVDKNKIGIAIKELHRILKKEGVIISRIFKKRNNEWLNKMPFECSEFGLTKVEINNLFKCLFLVEFVYSHDDYYIIKCTKK